MCCGTNDQFSQFALICVIFDTIYWICNKMKFSLYNVLYRYLGQKQTAAASF
jgi:hypothetical protein